MEGYTRIETKRNKKKPKEKEIGGNQTLFMFTVVEISLVEAKTQLGFIHMSVNCLGGGLEAKCFSVFLRIGWKVFLQKCE
jgi:hypothetical protein